jgi:hypothetical protein
MTQFFEMGFYFIFVKKWQIVIVNVFLRKGVTIFIYFGYNIKNFFGNMLPSDTRGYATPATPNAQWSRPTLCGYQNQPCVPLGYQSGYLLPHPT